MKRWIIAGLTLGFVLFSLTPTFYELSRRGDIPTTRSFELIHNYYTDYNFYLSRIREGYEGRWTVVERYTSEPHAGSFIQEFYLLLGHFAQIIPYHPFAVPAAYHIARAVLGLTLVALIAWWTTESFSVSAFSVLAFFTAMTGSSLPVIVAVGDTWRFGGYMPWWTVMDSLQRITFLPHLLAGQALMLFLMAAGADEKTMKRPGNWIFLGVLAFILGMILPPALIFLAAFYGFTILLEAIRDIKTIRDPKQRAGWLFQHIMPRFIVGIMSLPSILYFQLMFSVYPWKRLVEFDAQNPLVFRYDEYWKALGITLPLGILGLGWAVIKRDYSMKQAIAWIITWAFLLWVFQYIPQQSPLRFTEMLPHVPLSVLTVYLFSRIYEAAKKGLIAKNGRRMAIYPFAMIFLYVIFFIPAALGGGTMYSMWLWQKDFIDQKIRAGWPEISMNNYIVYPMKTFTDSLQFITDRTPKDSIILADMTAGNYIPAITGRTVYVGHENTVDKEEKLSKVRFFFSGKMTIDQAIGFLHGNRISYVFFGPQEQAEGGVIDITKEYPFLQEANRTADVVVYKVP